MTGAVASVTHTGGTHDAVRRVQTWKRGRTLIHRPVNPAPSDIVGQNPAASTNSHECAGRS